MTTNPPPDHIAEARAALFSQRWAAGDDFAAAVDAFEAAVRTAVVGVLAADTRAGSDDEADAVTVARRASQVITTMGADIRQLTSQRDRYRHAWKSARERAQAYGEGVLLHVAQRDFWQMAAGQNYAAEEAQRFALSEAVDLGTGAPWDAIHERVAELRRLAAETQQTQTETPSCPDPIECGHEAALGQARETNRRLNLRAQRLESELVAYRRAVGEWEISEERAYVPLHTIAVIAKAAGLDVPNRWTLHYERVEQADAAIERVRALHRKASHGDTCVYCAHGQRLGYDTTWPCDTIRALDAPAPVPVEAAADDEETCDGCGHPKHPANECPVTRYGERCACDEPIAAKEA